MIRNTLVVCLNKPTPNKSVWASTKISSFVHSWQNVGWHNVGAERTSWSLANSSNVINAAGWTAVNFTFTVELDVRRQVVGKVDDFAIGLVPLKSKLICGGINLAKVVDAGVGGTAVSAADKIWDGNRNDKSDDENQKEDFPNIKCRTGVFILFTHAIE